ncbi:MAG: hypothetical protein M1836_006593 [Candelina mexicana]|nr:MAG: hypothetical protein M1836_006593 [Candelina mexicana]
MRSHYLASALSAALYFALGSLGLNIIINNDDGFATVNIREFYKSLKAAGHNAWIVAPVENQSGRGGTLSFTDQAKLTSAGQYDSVPKGAPSFGHDPNDDHIWYYNGTPSACTLFALDYVVPQKWNGAKPDLLVSGPNFGSNAGPYLYTLSGTMGATYTAIERSIPAIAFSADGSQTRGYKEIVSNTKSGAPDPATVVAQLATNLVNQLARYSNGQQLLPDGYGISVNLPRITSLDDQTCLSPNYTQTRMTGGAAVSKAVFDEKKGVFHSENTFPEKGANTCINGDCSLPSESTVISKCQTAVTLFTIDYDAPTSNQSVPQQSRLVAPLVALANENLKTMPGGGTNENRSASNTASAQSASATPSATVTQTQKSGAEEGRGTMNPFALLVLAIGLVVLL